MLLFKFRHVHNECYKMLLGVICAVLCTVIYVVKLTI